MGFIKTDTVQLMLFSCRFPERDSGHEGSDKNNGYKGHYVIYVHTSPSEALFSHAQEGADPSDLHVLDQRMTWIVAA